MTARESAAVARIPPNPPNPGPRDAVPGQSGLRKAENPAVAAVRTPSPPSPPKNQPRAGRATRPPRPHPLLRWLHSRIQQRHARSHEIPDPGGQGARPRIPNDGELHPHGLPGLRQTRPSTCPLETARRQEKVGPGGDPIHRPRPHPRSSPLDGLKAATEPIRPARTPARAWLPEPYATGSHRIVRSFSISGLSCASRELPGNFVGRPTPGRTGSLNDSKMSSVRR